MKELLEFVYEHGHFGKPLEVFKQTTDVIRIAFVIAS